MAIKRCVNFEITRVLTTVILPIGVKYLVFQFLIISLMLVIALEQFISGMTDRSTENSKPNKVNLSLPQSKFSVTFSLSLEYFLRPIQITLVFFCVNL